MMKAYNKLIALASDMPLSMYTVQTHCGNTHTSHTAFCFICGGRTKGCAVLQQIVN